MRYFALALCLLPLPLFGQAKAAADDGSTTSEATTNDEGPAGIVPYVKGYNLSLGTTSQHDSSNGWSSLLTPNVAYRLNGHFSGDFEFPVYTYINVLVSGGTVARPTSTYVTKHAALGDAALNLHYETRFFTVDYNATVTGGFPTGKPAYGLGAGKYTYGVNNHFERSVGRFTPDLELGIGDSSSLEGTRVRRSFTTVGELAHFQVGTSFDLPRNMTFSADAYEDLPLTSQTIYSTTGKGRKKKTTATNAGVAEDNGFTNTLDIPLNGHATLSGFYNRSLRNHIDTAGFSLTFFLKAPPKNITR